MYFFRKQIPILIIFFAFFLLAVSCADSRVAQCTKFTEIVTRGNALIDTQKNNNDVGTTKNLAKNLNQTAKQLESLQLTDPNLNTIQIQSVKSFREMGQALGDIGKALEAGNNASTSIEGREQIQKAQADVIRAGHQANQAAANQDVLTNKLINYCKNS